MVQSYVFYLHLATKPQIKNFYRTAISENTLLWQCTRIMRAGKPPNYRSKAHFSRYSQGRR